MLVGAVLYFEVGNPITVLAGVFALKLAAYMQPFTHKLCNKLFHETDPIPQAMPEEDDEDEEED